MVSFQRWDGYRAESHARQTGLWFPELTPTKSTQIIRLDRDDLSRVIRWKTGHAFPRMQNYRAGQRRDPQMFAGGATKYPNEQTMFCSNAVVLIPH